MFVSRKFFLPVFSGILLKTTFNNISVISWRRTVILVEETGDPEKTTDLSQVTD
jgi:hypothetical protein